METIFLIWCWRIIAVWYIIALSQTPKSQITLGLLLPQCNRWRIANKGTPICCNELFFRQNWLEWAVSRNFVNWTSSYQVKYSRGSSQLLLDELYEYYIWHVPERKSKKRNIIPRDRKILEKKRKLRSRVFTTRGVEPDHTSRTVATINVVLKNSVGEERLREERKAMDAIKKNPKYFYAYAKKKIKTRSLVRPIIKDGKMICNAV